MIYQYVNRKDPTDIVKAFRYNRYSFYMDTKIIPNILPEGSYYFLDDACKTLCFKKENNGIEHLSWVIIHSNGKLENLSHLDFKEKYKFYEPI